MREMLETRFGLVHAWLLAGSREDGQALVEYALILSLIAVVAIGALQLTGTNVTNILNSIANAL